MLIILNISFTIIAFLIYLFLFWRKLKEDYARYQIFTTAFYSLLGIGVGKIIALSFFGPWWFYFSLLGGIMGLFLGIYRFKLRIFETVEASILGGLVLLLFTFLNDFVAYKNLTTGVGILVLLLLVFFYSLLNKHYKHFTWYASGRVGFSGLAVAGVFFLLRSLVALRLPDVLSFVGSKETFMSAVLAFLSFLILFNLSRKLP